MKTPMTFLNSTSLAANFLGIASFACFLFIAFLTISAGKAISSEAPETTSASGFAVVELFTSQGCSSCPPADRLLNDFATAYKDQPVYLLSFHVDYWDYLGWKDPFSDQAWSDRQRRYAQAFRSSRIYTPQMIVNGNDEFVGSRRQQAKSSIERSLKKSIPAGELTTSTVTADQRITVLIGNLKAFEGNRLNVALVQRQVANDVSRGENRGRHLVHANVVRDFKSLRLTGQDQETVTLSLPENTSANDMECIVYAQEKGTMKIVAAARAETSDISENSPQSADR